MIDDLQKYYFENGILSTSFTCAYKEKCQGDCSEFTGPKSAFVSSGYEANLLPRLLFLSLDSGRGDKNDEKRLPYAVRQQEEIERDVLLLHKGRHWYLTHELAWYIFRRFNTTIKIQDVKKYFAHANAAKCSMNKEQKEKADTVLFKNCKGYLPGELQVLSPEIIVTQGNEAKEAIGLIIYDKIIERIDEFASIIKLNGKNVFWLHTYHPRSGKYFHKQRDFDKNNKVAMGWERYSDKIYEFVQKNV